jgi:hypothetical protein
MYYILLFGLFVCIGNLNAQKQTVFDYIKNDKSLNPADDEGCGSQSSCFFGPNWITYNGYKHKGTHGCLMWFYGPGVYMLGRNMLDENGNPWKRGGGFAIDFPFKTGVNYIIEVEAVFQGPTGSDIGNGAHSQKRANHSIEAHQ